ncbi:MAG: sigma-70 family RNA polymerase sigma factor [Gammaproteobacteria bacterium]|nr:sigma-70 family RNA polymerase sigma factor [Gammaproteobacteria bacterium]
MTLAQEFDESAWLPRLRAGDKAAFAHMVRAYHGKLVATAKAIVGESIADEVVQETWVSAFKALPRFEGRSSLKTWLTRIVINEARSRLRHESRLISLDTSPYDEPESLEVHFEADGHWAQAPVNWDSASPEALLNGQELADCLENTLDGMPRMQRAVLGLRDMDGLELNEICNMLAVSESNVRVLLHRARARVYNMVSHFQETGEC